MQFSHFLKSLSVGLFLALAYMGVAQPVYTIQNIKGSCEGLSNGSFEVLVTAATGNVSVFFFGPPSGGPAATVGVPVVISNLPGLPFPAGHSLLLYRMKSHPCRPMLT